MHSINVVENGRKCDYMRYRDFCDFEDGGRRHLGFSKIRNFYGRSRVGGQYSSMCQISSKSVTWLKKYGDFTVFQMVAVRHFGFVGCLLGPPTMTN